MPEIIYKWLRRCKRTKTKHPNVWSGTKKGVDPDPILAAPVLGGFLRVLRGVDRNPPIGFDAEDAPQVVPPLQEDNAWNGGTALT